MPGAVAIGPAGKAVVAGQDGDAPSTDPIATRVATTLRRTADREDCLRSLNSVDAEIERSRAVGA